MKKIIKKIELLLLFLICSILVSCSISSKKAKKLYDEALLTQYDVIIVPGFPFKNGKWDTIMKARVYWAKHLYETGISKNIIYSGSAVYSPYYEGEIMKLYGLALQIDSQNIYTEIRAEHSTENVYYSYKKAKKLGFNKIALATDPFQSRLVKKFIKKELDEDVALIPFVFDTLKSIEPFMQDPLINYELAYDSNFISLAERESFWKRFRGTLGKNIDKTIYE